MGLPAWGLVVRNVHPNMHAKKPASCFMEGRLRAIPLLSLALMQATLANNACNRGSCVLAKCRCFSCTLMQGTKALPTNAWCSDPLTLLYTSRQHADDSPCNLACIEAHAGTLTGSQA